MNNDDPGFVPNNEINRRSTNSELEAKAIAHAFAENTEAKRAITNHISRYDTLGNEELSTGNNFFVDPVNNPYQHTPIFLQRNVTDADLRAKALQTSIDNLVDNRTHINDDGEMMRAIIRIKEIIKLLQLDIADWMHAKNSIWNKSRSTIINEYLTVQNFSNEQLCDQILILMALAKDDPYIKHVVTQKVTGQFDLNRQATRIAALR